MWSAPRCWAIATAAPKSSGSPASTRSRATSPPHDAPMQTKSYAIPLANLAVKPLFGVQLLEAGLVRSELDRLLVAERQDPERLERVVEQVVNPVLEALAEIDHHVPADDDVELVECAVGDEVVVGEHDAAAELVAERRLVALH